MKITSNTIKAGFLRGIPKMDEYISQESILGVYLALQQGDGFCLGGWFYYHSGRYAAQRMDAEERELFSKIIGESKVSSPSEWCIGELFLRVYWERFGNMTIQFRYKTAEGFPLGKWVADARKLGREGKLDSKQLDALKKYEININFEGSDGQRTTFEDGFQEFLDGYESYQRLGVNKDTVSASGYPLGTWMANRVWDMINGSLGLNNMIAMASAGCLPQLSDESTYWYEGLNSLTDLSKKIDVSKLPFDYVDSLGFRLGDWLCYLRDLHMSGKLRQSKRTKLLSLGIDISKRRDSDWDYGYRELTAHAPELIYTSITRNTVSANGYPIGRWVESNLRRAVNERLSNDKIMYLKCFGQGWVARCHQKWRDEASLVEQEMVKHPQRTVSTVEDERSGHFLKPIAARYEFLDSNVSHSAKLDRRLWAEAMSNLLDYQISNNQLSVPVGFVCENGFPLGKWIDFARTRATLRLLSFSQLWIMQVVGLSLESEDKSQKLQNPPKVTDFSLERWLKDRKRQSMRF